MFWSVCDGLFHLPLIAGFRSLIRACMRWLWAESYIFEMLINVCYERYQLTEVILVIGTDCLGFGWSQSGLDP